jgi:hypothetical protein
LENELADFSKSIKKQNGKLEKINVENNEIKIRLEIAEENTKKFINVTKDRYFKNGCACQ